MKAQGVTYTKGYLIIKVPNAINSPVSDGSAPIINLNITQDDVVAEVTTIRSNKRAIRVFSHVAQLWLAEWRIF